MESPKIAAQSIVAITNELRQDNPCNGLHRLPQQHKKMPYYTSEQFKQFDALFTREEYQYQLSYRLLMHTGLRNGEGRDHIFFTLMKRLGHSSINTTINVYSHLFPTQQKKLLMPLIIFNNKAN